MGHQSDLRDKTVPCLFNPHFRMIDLALLEENLAFYHSVELTGLNIKADKEGFFVILKGRQNGRPVVHFTGGRTFGDAVEAIGFEVQQQALKWRPDQYP